MFHHLCRLHSYSIQCHSCPVLRTSCYLQLCKRLHHLNNHTCSRNFQYLWYTLWTCSAVSFHCVNYSDLKHQTVTVLFRAVWNDAYSTWTWVKFFFTVTSHVILFAFLVSVYAANTLHLCVTMLYRFRCSVPMSCTSLFVIFRSNCRIRTYAVKFKFLNNVFVRLGNFG